MNPTILIEKIYCQKTSEQFRGREIMPVCFIKMKYVSLRDQCNVMYICLRQLKKNFIMKMYSQYQKVAFSRFRDMFLCTLYSIN